MSGCNICKCELGIFSVEFELDRDDVDVVVVDGVVFGKVVNFGG